MSILPARSSAIAMLRLHATPECSTESIPTGSTRTESTLIESTLHDRICATVAGLSFRKLGDITIMNAETVRRYVRGADPSVAFITALCDAFDLSAEWLLYGRGPRRRSDAVEELLRTAGYTRLLAALAERLEHAEAP